MVRTIDKATLTPTAATRLFGDVAGVTGNLLPAALGEYIAGARNVRADGALGDGTTDDTAALQAHLDGYVGVGVTGPLGGTSLFPAGTYRITDTLRCRNKAGVTLAGAGFGNMYTAGTTLLWDGPTDGRAMLDLSGGVFVTVANLAFVGAAGAAGQAVNVVGIKAVGNGNTLDGLAINGSFYNQFAQCYFQNVGVGVDLGVTIDQVDTYTFRKCWWYMGASDIALRINSGNTLSCQLYDCTMAQAGAGKTTSTGVHLAAGSVELYGCLTAGLVYGVRLTGASTPVAVNLTAHHSEEDDYALYADVTGNHQKANPVVVNGLFAYSPQVALFHLGNANLMYDLRNVRALVSGGNDDILVMDDPEEVWLHNVTISGSVKRISDAAAATVYGWYGPQGVPRRPYRLPNELAPEGGVLGVRNGTAPQGIEVYNTFTSTSNYERLALRWAANTAYLLTEKDGAGAARNFSVMAGGNLFLGAGAAGERWGVFSSGHFWPLTDAAYDLGEPSLRVRTAYLSGKVLAAGGLGAGNSAAATTPGAVTKKLEVFDATGASLGFLAVYGSIT